MKRYLTAMLALLMVIGLCGCSTLKNKITEPTETKPVVEQVEKNDAGFVKLVQRSLEERWASLEEKPAPTSSQNTFRARMKEVLTQELTTIGPLSDYTFTNSGLKALAQRYIAALNSQLEGAPLFDDNTEEYRRLYTLEGYNERCIAAAEMAENYGLVVSDQWKYRLADLVEDGTKAAEENAMLDQFSALLNENLVFESRGYGSYEAELVNPTQKDLENISIRAVFYDDTDKVVYESSSYAQKWEAGDSWNATLYCSQNFDHVTAYFSWYSNVSSCERTTEPKAISCENVYSKVKLVMVNKLPEVFKTETYSQNYTFTVTDYRFEFNYMDDGKANYYLYLSGTKNTDSNGDKHTGSCEIAYRVTSEDGTIVYDSGSIFTPKLEAGQSFEDTRGYLRNLPNGTLLVELMEAQY